VLPVKIYAGGEPWCVLFPGSGNLTRLRQADWVYWVNCCRKYCSLCFLQPVHSIPPSVKPSTIMLVSEVALTVPLPGPVGRLDTICDTTVEIVVLLADA